ncbi:MAG: methylenetetrahydrofolate reductase [Dissulfurispiraceae bacterium]
MEYIITNDFYDNQYFFDFVRRGKAAGINIPILPSIMPTYSIKIIEKLSGI